MDFAAALANLQKTANEAANSGSKRPRNPDQHSRRSNQRPRNEYANPLHGMQRFGYHVQPYVPDRLPEDVLQRKPHIALLLICIDGLPYEHIWRHWAEHNNTHVSLICHAKYPDQIKSPWLKQRILTKPPRIGRGNTYADPEYLTHSPEWGSVQITRAMIDLLAYASQIKTPADGEKDERFASSRFYMQDTVPEDLPPVDQFIFISETCLPTATLSEFKDQLLGSPQDYQTSWVSARNRNTPGTPRNKYEGDQFKDIHRMVPGQYRWKADQWHSLCRSHAQAILDIDQHMRPPDRLWQSFTKVNASDEMYFPTALALRGILTEETKQGQVKVRPITYTDWSEGMRNPASFSKGPSDFARVSRLARKQGSLIARKFVLSHEVPGQESTVTGEISVDEWKKEIETLTQEVPIEWKDAKPASKEDVTSETKEMAVAKQEVEPNVQEQKVTDGSTGGS